MIDFKEIDIDGEVWELFARDFLQSLGFFIERSVDRGADGKKDLIVSEQLKGTLGNYKFTWLVSCKHKALSKKSVTENDEPNILERVSGFNCDGFIGFYSTLPSSSLNNRLTQLKDNFTIKDYRVFDHKTIENYLIQIGYSNLLMRYFPNSYKIIKPLHLITDDYIPLKCHVCEKDILQEMYYKTYTGLIAYAEEMNFREDKTLITYKFIYWACKGKCDKKLERYYYDKHGLTTSWTDIGDLVIPALFIKFILTTLNQLHSKKYKYDGDTFKKEKEFILALSQKVLRETTDEERQIVLSVIGNRLDMI